MINSNNTKLSVSLIQSISAVFLCFLILMIGLSVLSNRGLEQVGTQFTTLSDKALPLSATNAKLTQSLLEQTKQLSYATQVTSAKALQHNVDKIEQVIEETQRYQKDVANITQDYSDAISPEQQGLLNSNLTRLNQLTEHVLATQTRLLKMQESIDAEVGGFRYGISSIGPEMNRLSSFLSLDNPESSDAANRFSASASSMESTFLMLMMQHDLAKAQQEYQEMHNRIAGINLAYDDFLHWHPEIVEFASLTAPYEMVKAGFKDDAS
ncbi:methyl-accepting chemotaxis protein I [Vibrio ponticus]|nr:methyl-accepting chemotaxis protein I [Vibrio ponticus]